MWVDTSMYHLGGFIFTAHLDLRGIDDPHPVRAFQVEGDKTPETFSAPEDMVEITITGRRGSPSLHCKEGERHNSVSISGGSIGMRTGLTPVGCRRGKRFLLSITG